MPRSTPTSTQPMLNLRLYSVLRGLFQLAIVIGALAGVVVMQRTQLHRGSGLALSPQQMNQQEELRLNVLQRSPSFGFDNLLADWVFLNFVQYDGDIEVRKQLGYGLAPKYFDLITRLDPRFVDSYLFLSGTLSYQLGEPELAAQYFKRGTSALTPQAHPRAFLPWRLQGLDQLLLLGDIPGSIQSHEMASIWSAQSPQSEIQEASRVFKLTADFLRSDPNSSRVRFWAWASIYAQSVATRDQQTQERAKREMLALGAIERTRPDGQVYFEWPEPAKQPENATKPEPKPETPPETTPPESSAPAQPASPAP